MRIASDLTQKTIDHLVELAESTYGLGWQAEVDRRLGQTRGAVGKAIKRRSLRLDAFLEILQVLDVRPASFMAELEQSPFLDPFDQLEAFAKIVDQDSELEQLARKLDFGPDSSQIVAQDRILDAIAKEKESDSAAALTLIRAALDLLAAGGISQRLTFPLLLEWSSCKFRLDKIEQALAGYLFTCRQAKQLGSRIPEAETLLRLPEVVVRHSADYQTALDLASQSYLAFTDLGDQNGAGKALVVRARYFHHLGYSEVAINNLSLALEFLPKSEIDYIFSAHLSLAVIFKDLEQFQKAQSRIDQAKKMIAGANRKMVGTLFWADAEISQALGSSQRAELSYHRAREIFFELSPVAAALVSIDLATHLLQDNRPAEAKAVTKGLIPLINPLAKYPIAEAAITELVRLALSGAALSFLDLNKAAVVLKRSSAHLS